MIWSRTWTTLLIFVLVWMSLPLTVAGREQRARDITRTSHGRELVEQTVDGIRARGLPVSAANLRAIESPDGTVTVLPGALAPSLEVARVIGQDGRIEYAVSVEVGPQLARVASAASAVASPSSLGSGGAPYWSIREQDCFASFPVDSARFDVWYRISKLIYDGSGTRDYWVLEVNGTAFEFHSGLSAAWISGERTSGSTAQRWAPRWSPGSSLTKNCVPYHIGISHLVSIGGTFEVCERWSLTKSANQASPYLKVEWSCNFIFCSIWDDDREVAFAYEVSVGQGRAPRYRIGIGMRA